MMRITLRKMLNTQFIMDSKDTTIINLAIHIYLY